MSLLTTFVTAPINNFDLSNKDNILNNIEKMCEYNNTLSINAKFIEKSISYFRMIDDADLATIYYLIAQLFWIDSGNIRLLRSNMCLCALVLLKAYIMECNFKNRAIRDDVDFIINFANKIYPLNKETSLMVKRYFNSRNIDILDSINDFNLINKDTYLEKIDEILKYSYDLAISLNKA